MTDKYKDFHDEILRLTKENEFYQDQYEALKRINDTQVETIRSYASIVSILDAELKKLRGETICD